MFCLVELTIIVYFSLIGLLIYLCSHPKGAFRSAAAESLIKLGKANLGLNETEAKVRTERFQIIFFVTISSF